MLAGSSASGARTAPTPRQAASSAVGNVGHTFVQAVQHVFAAQPPAQKQAIVRAAMANPSHPAAAAVLDSVRGSAAGRLASIRALNNTGPGIVGDVGSVARNIGHALSPSNVYGGSGKPSKSFSMTGTVTPFAKGTLGAKAVVNAGKDIVNLPAEAFSTAGVLGSDLAQGKLGKFANDLVINPAKQLAEHPIQTFVNHPVDTYLMVAGALHGVTRPVAGAVRTLAPDSAAGRALALPREPIALTGQLERPRPQYSPYPLIQAAQKLADQAKLTRNDQGSLVTRRQDLQDKLTALETSREVGMIERVRRANRDAAVQRRMQAVQPARLVRAAKQAARTLKSGREPVVIPGAREALGLVPDLTIRSARTAADDLAKYIKLASANRANLLDHPDLLKEHDANIAKLNDIANGLRSGKVDPGALIRAGNAYAKDYRPLQNEAARFGHFAGRNTEALTKRELAHYAILHMGAKYAEDPAKIAAYEALKDEVLSNPHLSFSEQMGRLRGKNPEGELLLGDKPLTSAQIRAHMRGKVDHPSAFVTDKPRPGSAFYVSSDRRPLPESARNTYFAYTHALTDTSHEALLRQHVRMQGIIDAHKAQNRMLDQIAIQKKGGGYWDRYTAAKRDAPNDRYVPIRVGQAFHPQDSLAQALEGTNPATLDEEAALHGLDLSHRLQDSGPGKYALISKVALQRLEEHKAQITPNLGQRTISNMNAWFRRVALSTSAKHVPGVASEQIIRDIANGVGFSSWITGHRIVGRLPEDVATRVKGGQLAGASLAAERHFVAERYQGTSLYRPIKAFERYMQKPGARQLSTAWRAWSDFAIKGVKKVLEEQHAIADVGKMALQDFGTEHGPFFKALRLQSEMLDDAARGLHDPAKQREFRVLTERIRGRWTDLTPHGQWALMYSPFGLWWANSVRFLGRAPIDMPVLTGAAASATTGTEQKRQQLGLDMFAPGHLPLYMQGGIPLGGGRVLAQNYYSPFGVANDPLETGASLLEPWLSGPLLAAYGDNYLGKSISSPGNPHGSKQAGFPDRAAVIANSILSSFIPLYTKAQQIAQGGASAYDTSTLWDTQTKTPGQGPLAGVEKALRPYRMYTNKAKAGSGSASVPGFGSTAGNVAVPGFGSSGNVAVPGFP